MTNWKDNDDFTLISLANQGLSVEEMQPFLPDFSPYSIAIRLNNLRKQKKIPSNFKTRMKKWDEEKLIKYAQEGLNPSEIAEKFTGTSVNIIIGRLYHLRKEKKISKDYILTLRKQFQQKSNKNEPLERENVISDSISTESDIICEKFDKKIDSIDPIKSISKQTIVLENVDNQVNKIKQKIFNSNQTVTDPTLRKVPLPRYTIIETQTSIDGKKISFLDLLKTNIELYEGTNKEIQKYCPMFFELLSNILNDKFVDWHTRLMISAALGYFVLEEDVFQDTEENGYIDDLYLLTYVLNEIKNNLSAETIIRNWNGEEDIIPLIDDIFNATSDIIGPLTKKILKKVGLTKFTLFSLEEYSGDYSKREARLIKEKRDLLSYCAYIIEKVENEHITNPNYIKIKTHMENYYNYDEIQRIIEISKLYHEIEIESDEKEENFNLMIERKMREAQLKMIFDKK